MSLEEMYKQETGFDIVIDSKGYYDENYVSWLAKKLLELLTK